MKRSKIIVPTFKLHLAQSLGRATFRFCIFVQPLIYTFVLYYMYKGSSVPNYINYVILGSGLCSLWSSVCFSSAGDIERERYMGTLENLYACPSSFRLIVLGKILANTLLGLSGIMLSIIFSGVFFGKFLIINNIIFFILSFIMMIISFMSVSILIAPIFTLSKNARAMMNCLEYPIFMLCGFIFPVSMLPKIIQPLSYILPPTVSIELLRESAEGNINFRLYFVKMIFLISLCIIYAILSSLLFKLIDKKTRIDGTLGVS